MNAKQGEVWLADLGLAAKTRPVVILSRSDPQAPRALVTYVPLTTQNRYSRYEVGTWQREVPKGNLCGKRAGHWLHSCGTLATETRFAPDRGYGEDQASYSFCVGSVIEGGIFHVPPHTRWEWIGKVIH